MKVKFHITAACDHTDIEPAKAAEVATMLGFPVDDIEDREYELDCIGYPAEAPVFHPYELAYPGSHAEAEIESCHVTDVVLTQEHLTAAAWERLEALAREAEWPDYGPEREEEVA